MRNCHIVRFYFAVFALFEGIGRKGAHAATDGYAAGNDGGGS
jgi:hypothetical protein